MKTGKFFSIWLSFAVSSVTLAYAGNPSNPACGIAGQADSYVLALSWQPAFCKTVPMRKDKPECGVADPNSYQAQNFTLHGLWPNLDACGISYGFCGPVKQSTKPFINYPEVPMDPGVRNALAQVMPSVAYGSGLERHEWFKHGTCSQLPVDVYFSTAQNLTRQFNASGMSDFMRANLGRDVAVSDFFAAVDRALGPGASEHFHLTCQNDLLVDVWIDLMAPVAPGSNLLPLLQGVPGKGSSTHLCGDTFRIEPIGIAAGRYR